MPLLTGLARALDLAQTDLVAIQVRLEVVHVEAWLPAKPDHDRPTPHRPPDVDPDFVKGEKWDCGLASYPAREAWTRMVDHLDEAGAQTVEVWELLTGRPAVTPVAHESRLDGAMIAADVLALSGSVRRLATRLRDLQRLHDGLGVNSPRGRWLADQLMGPRGRPAGTPCNHIELAKYQAFSVVAIVGTGRKPPICSKCRKIGTIGLRHNGGKCDACAKRDWRLGARQRRAAIAAHRAS